MNTQWRPGTYIFFIVCVLEETCLFLSRKDNIILTKQEHQHKQYHMSKKPFKNEALAYC